MPRPSLVGLVAVMVRAKSRDKVKNGRSKSKLDEHVHRCGKQGKGEVEAVFVKHPFIVLDEKKESLDA